MCVWVSEWDDASLCGCVCEFVLTDSTKKLNKFSKEKQIAITKQLTEQNNRCID